MSEIVEHPPDYTARLNDDPNWGFNDIGWHFDEASCTFKSLRSTTTLLTEFGLPYAILGDLAMFRHGFRRFTEFVDVLLRREDFDSIRSRLIERGYRARTEQSRTLLDPEFGVQTRFFRAGDQPREFEATGIVYPDPRGIRFEFEGITYSTLESIFALKLASGL